MGYFKKKFKAIKKEYKEDAKARSKIRSVAKKEGYRAKLIEAKRYERTKAKINTDKKIKYAKEGGFFGAAAAISKNIQGISPAPKKKRVTRRVYVQTAIPTRKKKKRSSTRSTNYFDKII